MRSAPGRPPLVVVAAAIVAGRRLLLVSKRAAPELFYLPGGKPEPGESDEACLRRELAEELDASVATCRRLLDVSSVAALEAMPMEMAVYRVTLDREPSAASEIAALGWYSPGELFAGALAPAVSEVVVPALVEAGLIGPAGSPGRA